jgi:hypothetical protein
MPSECAREGAHSKGNRALTAAAIPEALRIIPTQLCHQYGYSGLSLYGNVVSLESFMRILLSSLPQGALAVRFPSLQPVFKHLMKLAVVRRRGLPFTKEVIESVANPMPVAK